MVRLQGSLRYHRVLTLSLLLIGFLRALANSCNMSWVFGVKVSCVIVELLRPTTGTSFPEGE